MVRDWRLEHAERIYGALLWLYPVRFRLRFGQEMALVFRDCCHDQLQAGGNSGFVAFWLHTVKDVLTSLGRQQGRQLIQDIDLDHPLFAMIDSTLIPTIIVTNLIALGVVVTILVRSVPGTPIPLDEFMLISGMLSVVFGILGVLSSLIMARLRPTVRLWVKLS